MVSKKYEFFKFLFVGRLQPGLGNNPLSATLSPFLP
jgi:hypothetical protein